MFTAVSNEHLLERLICINRILPSSKYDNTYFIDKHLLVPVSLYFFPTTLFKRYSPGPWYRPAWAQLPDTYLIEYICRLQMATYDNIYVHLMYQHNHRPAFVYIRRTDVYYVI